MTKSTRVLCVEDEWAIAELLRMAIDAEPDLESVGTLPRSDGLDEKIAESRPDVVVIDLTLPGGDPLAVIKAMTGGGSPSPRFIVYSGYDDADTLDRVRDAGAVGFVSKRHDVDRLLEAIRKVNAGERVTQA